MRSRAATFTRFAGAVLGLALLAGCARVKPELAIGPSVAAAPLVKLGTIQALPIEGKALLIGRPAARMDARGRVHVFAIGDGRTPYAREFVIGPDGVEDRFPAAAARVRHWALLDEAVVGRDGAVCALARGRLSTATGGVWRDTLATPWQGWPEFAHLESTADGRIVCAYRAPGAAVGAHGRVRVATFFLVILPVPIPYPSHPGKLVLVEQRGAGWSQGRVLDPGTGDDALDARLAVAGSRAHLVCATDHDWVTRVSRADVDLDATAATAPRPHGRMHPNAVAGSFTGDYSTLAGRGPVMAIAAGYTGAFGSISQPALDARTFDVAADAESATELIAVLRPATAGARGKPAGEATVRAVRGGVLSAPVRLAARASQIVLASGGGGRYHALILTAGRRQEPGHVLYSRFDGSTWSTAIDVGLGAELGALTADGDRALALWLDPDRERVLTRWIEPAGGVQ